MTHEVKVNLASLSKLSVSHCKSKYCNDIVNENSKYLLEIGHKAFCRHPYVVVPEEKYIAPTFLREVYFIHHKSCNKGLQPPLID